MRVWGAEFGCGLSNGAAAAKGNGVPSPATTACPKYGPASAVGPTHRAALSQHCDDMDWLPQSGGCGQPGVRAESKLRGCVSGCQLLLRGCVGGRGRRRLGADDEGSCLADAETPKPRRKQPDLEHDKADEAPG
jgi:hypothetical protein